MSARVEPTGAAARFVDPLRAAWPYGDGAGSPVRPAGGCAGPDPVVR
ncbi:hypothetical protein [Streptomyces xanthii]|nr:hypothetical protein [Streptomyces xanthii]